MEKTAKELEIEIQEDQRQIDEINRKIENNDYNQLKEVHHDKMVLENRKMILINKSQSRQLFEQVKKIENDIEELKNQNKILSEKNSILIDVVKEIGKNNKISSTIQEKIKNLTE